MAQMKEQIKAPEKELSDEEIANLSDAEFKNTGTHRHWVQTQNKGRTEGYAKWNKGKYTGNQKWRDETGIQTKDLKQNEEINIKLEQNEETGIYKNEKLRKLWDNFKCSNIWIIGVPEGGEEEQEIENK